MEQNIKGRAIVYKAQVHSIHVLHVDYAPLCWINASPTILGILDNIQKKALKCHWG